MSFGLCTLEWSSIRPKLTKTVQLFVKKNLWKHICSWELFWKKNFSNLNRNIYRLAEKTFFKKIELPISKFLVTSKFRQNQWMFTLIFVFFQKKNNSFLISSSIKMYWKFDLNNFHKFWDHQLQNFCSGKRN